MFSDSILISWPLTNMPPDFIKSVPPQFQESAKNRHRDLSSQVFFARDLQENIFLKWGLLVRGVIHCGPLYHDKHLILGKGLVDAVDFEKKQKKPGIYISKTAYQKYRECIDSELQKPSRKTFYRRDEEGDFYVFPVLLVKEENRERVNDFIKRALEKSCNNSNDEVHKKWKWFKNIIESY